MSKRRLVVIGNGMAGARAVENVLVRDGASQFDVVMFGDEPYGNYNRIMLSGILNGSKSLDDILINTPAWYAENGVTLHSGERVVEIDRAAKVVVSANGISEPYDILVIATGSYAFLPPFKGATDPQGRRKAGLFTYRTLDDCHAMAAYAAESRRSVTIGGGLLGLEAARALDGLGCESHVVHLAAHLLDVQLDATGGRDAAANHGRFRPSTFTPARPRPRSWARIGSPGSRSRMDRASTATSSWWRLACGRTVRSA